MCSIAGKQEIQKKVYHVDELKKRKVVEHNDLISSVAKMDKTPLKIFELAVSYIDTDNPPKENTIYLSKKELFAFFDVSDNDKHSRFKDAVEKMQRQAFFEIKQLKDNQKDYEITSIVPIPTVKWNSYNDEVMIRFNQDIMPYLIELRANFTQYVISDIMELNSKYSIILYKWLCMHYNQYEHYSAKGGRRNEQIETYRDPSISVKDLRTMTDTVNEYNKYNDWDRYILKNSLKEINASTHFNVTYDKIKKGRSIDSIHFHITKKHVAKNEFYKQEQQDVLYLEGKVQKEQTKQALFSVAMQSPYTKILSEQFIIGINDFMDIDLMSGLQQVVYPFYDELQALRGIDGVRDHLSYVASKQESYSKKNVVKYLKIAIETYLPTVKRQELS